MQTHVNFLHEELTKLPSFPRKALEAEFNLYKGEMGKELYGLDMLHKFAWARVSYQSHFDINMCHYT
jgi:Fe-S cluster biosynthesis and repair protein YggX